MSKTVNKLNKETFVGGILLIGFGLAFLFGLVSLGVGLLCLGFTKALGLGILGSLSGLGVGTFVSALISYKETN